MVARVSRLDHHAAGRRLEVSHQDVVDLARFAMRRGAHHRPAPRSRLVRCGKINGREGVGPARAERRQLVGVDRRIGVAARIMRLGVGQLLRDASAWSRRSPEPM